MAQESKSGRWIRRFCGVLLFLLIWQIASMLIRQRILLVSPGAVLLRLCTIWQVGGFVKSLAFTFCHIIGGYLLGVTAGILLAALSARLPVAEDLLWPWMAVIRSVPVASIVIICLIWLSAKNLSVFISFLIVLPVIYQNTLTGLRGCDPKMREVADVFHLPPLRRLRCLILPQLAQSLFSACSVTAGMAWKAGIAAEIIGTPNGSVGRAMYLAKLYLDTDDLLAWTVIVVVLSVVWEKLFLFVLKKIFAAVCGTAFLSGTGKMREKEAGQRNAERSGSDERELMSESVQRKAGRKGPFR